MSACAAAPVPDNAPVAGERPAPDAPGIAMIDHRPGSTQGPADCSLRVGERDGLDAVAR